MEQPQFTPGPLPEAPPPTMSLGGRLLNVFATPGDAFQEVKSAGASTANWLVPALILIVVSWVAAWLIFSQDSIKHQLSEATDQAIQKQAEQRHMSVQDADRLREAAAKWGPMGRVVVASGLPLLVGFGSPFVWGLFLWLVGTKAFKADFAYMKAVEVVGLGNMISVLDAIVKTLLIVGLGNLYAAPSVALLVQEFDPQNTVHSLLALANVMTFWLLAVRALGLARLSGASFTKAALWVLGIWAAYTGFFVGLRLLAQAAFKRMGG